MSVSLKDVASRFHYNAGFASREEDPAAPGVMAAADDPPQVFETIHMFECSTIICANMR